MPATGIDRWRLPATLGIGLGLAAVAWATLSGPYSLAELCTRYRPTWVFALFERPPYTALSGEAFLAAVGGLSGLYLVGLGLARRLRGTLAALVLLGLVPALLVVALLPGYPLLSNDIFKYVMTGRILAVYGENPFIHVPADFPDDRFHDLVYWKAVVNAHGPLWRGMEGASALAGGERCASAVMAMKAWPMLAYLATCGALYSILRAWQPERALSGTLLYAWSPLVVLEAVQNGHNDVVAALPAVVAVWLGIGGRWRLAFPLLAVAVLVKPTAVALGPLLLVAAIREGRPSFVAAAREGRPAWIAAIQGIAIAAVLVGAAYAPFWAGPQTLAGLDRDDIFSASPAELLLRWLESAGWPLDRAMTVTAGLATGLFGLLYLGVLLAVWQRRVSLAGAAAATYLAYLLVGAQWFNPWYLLWLLPFAALAPERPIRVVGVAFGLLAPLTYLLQYQAGPVVLFVFLPTIALVAYWRRAFGLGWSLSNGRPSGTPTLAARHG